MNSGSCSALTLPAADPAELEEMVRIQLEKILPYSVDSVALAMQEISRGEAEVVVAVETVHQDRLVALCRPLEARGCWPLRVMFQSLVLAGGMGPGEHEAFIYRELGRYVLGICEGGRLSFAQAIGGSTPEELAAELPGVLLGAELDGVPAAFDVVRLDDRETGAGAALGVKLDVVAEPFDTAAAALAGAAAGERDGDLSPPQWRTERQRGERRARTTRRLVLGAGIYAGVLLLALLGLGVMKLRVARLESRLKTLRPLAASAQAADARWKTLAPAVDWHRYLAEIVEQVCECLPPDESVRLTAFDQTARGIAIQGEAPSPAMAVEFTEKLRAQPALKIYHFDADPPSILPNGRARFRISGNL